MVCTTGVWRWLKRARACDARRVHDFIIQVNYLIKLESYTTSTILYMNCMIDSYAWYASHGYRIPRIALANRTLYCARVRRKPCI
jgi:hypothetical protein